ncbi:uncharacterized protein LOC124290065 isoform X2 [Haliotis rubra]|uniref:uncharacterized protein LOC124290065 isoform X2 n=1 Tax=Haliotis rubra TaxID=36100 RepID=UPI001EE610EF|nr:uncharacterized protein LOC124290065 isoform X2 [Haliotis rubra]
MLALRLAVFAIFFCGICGFPRLLSYLLTRCNPPEELVGKFCAATDDNDLNHDGRVTFSDAGKDYLNYNYDDDICVRKEWEVVTRLLCRYGFSEEYSRYMARSFAANAGGFLTFNVSKADFLMLQYTRFKNTYCSDPKNRVSPVDKRQCDEVDKLKPADIKCA